MRRLATLPQETQKVPQKYQGRYRKEFYAKLRVTQELRRGDLVYVDHPPSWAMTATDKISLGIKSNILAKTTGWYQVLQVTTVTVTIEENGTPITIPIDRVIHASTTTSQDISLGTIRLRIRRGGRITTRKRAIQHGRPGSRVKRSQITRSQHRQKALRK